MRSRSVSTCIAPILNKRASVAWEEKYAEVRCARPGDPHPLAYFLHEHGFELRLIPTLALARTREAMHNSWDKNDPKDAQVILHLLKTGLAQTWHDPMVKGINDIQELSKTHFQVTLARVRVWHTLRNHYFARYFPDRSFHSF